METLSIRAHAKLNLGLRITGRRKDGYHLLQTIMVAVDLADNLRLQRMSSGVSVLCTPGLGIPTEKNLAHQAVSALLDRAGDRAGVTVAIQKHIPPGTGLGGGSSDAAAALVGTASLLKLEISRREMAELALSLGADVPFFLGSSPAWAEGVGEALHSVPTQLPGAFVVLIPPQGCPTAEIYRVYDELRIPFSPPSKPPPCPDYRNDLYPAAIRVYPQLADYLELLSDPEALGTGMTGAGSALFAAFASREQATACMENLRTKTDARLTVAVPMPGGYKFSE